MTINLKEIRKEFGFTQETMAQLIGVQRSTYANWETERRITPPYIEQRVKRLFNVEAIRDAKQLRAERLLKTIAK